MSVEKYQASYFLDTTFFLSSFSKNRDFFVRAHAMYYIKVCLHSMYVPSKYFQN